MSVAISKNGFGDDMSFVYLFTLRRRLSIYCLARFTLSGTFRRGRGRRCGCCAAGTRVQLLDVPCDDEYPSKLSFRLENSKWSQQYSVVPEDEDVIMRVYSDADRDDVVNLRIARGVGGTAGSVRVEIYCSFWMLNRTGLPLLYSSQPGAGGTNAHGPSMISDLVALATFRGSSDTSYHGWVAPTKLRSAKQITMFATESANLRVRVANSKPSEYFDIEDHIGSLSGTLVIGSAEPGLLRSYDIGVSVDIGPGLLAKRTRIVSFVPRYFCAKHELVCAGVQER